MAELTLHRYSPSDAEEWNAFVGTSRNGTFLLDRAYMDYHSDRFDDHSIIVRKDGRVVALLPANLAKDVDGRVLQSHGGLTYGGWVLPPRHTDEMDVLECFRLLRLYAKREGIDALDYKPIPYIYHRMPSQEDLYAIFREGGMLTERNISCCINLEANPGLNTQQKRNLKRAALLDALAVYESSDCAAFHNGLASCLQERHGVAPVHSSSELQLLMERFPQIRLFMIGEGREGKPQAGVCVYDTGNVAHAQYIWSSPEGRCNGLLTRLFTELFTVFQSCRYFDFGICNEDHGRYLNEGLYRQKSSLGGSGVIYDRYRINYR